MLLKVAAATIVRKAADMGIALVATRGMALAQVQLLMNTVTDRVQVAGHAILRDAAWPAHHAVLNGRTGLHTNSDGDVVIQLFLLTSPTMSGKCMLPTVLLVSVVLFEIVSCACSKGRVWAPAPT